MKSFKKHIAEVAQPRSPEEKAFKDQHSYEVKSHPVAPDAVFTGEITGKPKQARVADVKDDEKAYDAATPKKKDSGVKLESSEMDRARYDADNDSAPKKKVTLAKAPWEKKKKDEELSAAQKKIDHNKNGKIDGQDLAMLRKKKQNESVEEVNETTSSAVKHMVNQTGPDGKTRTVMKKVRTDRSDEKGQDVIGEIARSMTPMRNKFGGTVIPKKFDAYKKHMKTHKLDEPTVRMIADNPDAGESKRMLKNPKYAKAHDMYKAAHKNESVEDLEEAVRFKKGPIRLKNGKQVMVSDQDAKLLTKMFKDLNPANQRNMQKVLMKDVAGYEEIRGFAREAL